LRKRVEATTNPAAIAAIATRVIMSIFILHGVWD
jgi:hypothetical protein